MGVDKTGAKFLWLVSLTLLTRIIWRLEGEYYRLFRPWSCHSASQQGGQPWWREFFCLCAQRGVFLAVCFSVHHVVGLPCSNLLSSCQ